MTQDKVRLGRGLAERGALAALLVFAGLAHGVGAWAAIGGSYDGSVTVKKPPAIIAAAAALESAPSTTSARATVSGTIVLTSPDTGLSGAFAVTGTATRLRLRVSGPNSAGATLRWAARITGSQLAGRITVKNSYRRFSGTLSLSPATSTGDGSGCDGVFTANQQVFVDDVMGQVLVPICARCHVAGGAAASARLRVTAGDPLATARTVALLVDPVDPAHSRILDKPTARTPHGGGPQLLAGTPEEQILQTRVDLLVAADCLGASPGYGDTGESIYANACASCHGADARGTSTAPDIHCARSVGDVVRHGNVGVIGTMPSFGDMTEAQIGLLQAHIDGLCPAATASGADLFASNCAPCHGGGAAGSPGRPDIRCAVPSWIARTVRSGRGVGHAVMPSFVSSELADGELAKIVGWLQGKCVATPAGRYASNCATCHGATAAGGGNADGVRGPEIVCHGTLDFIEKVTQGSGPMPAFPEIQPAEVTRIADWVHASFCVE